MEDIEKTIEEEAIRYIEHIAPSGPNFDLTQLECEKQAFESGAAFALSLNRWRKVSEELPELWQMVLFKVHVYAENYQSQSVTVGRLDTGGYHLQLNDEDIFKIEVEEWKPII